MQLAFRACLVVLLFRAMTGVLDASRRAAVGRCDTDVLVNGSWAVEEKAVILELDNDVRVLQSSLLELDGVLNVGDSGVAESDSR